MELKPTIPCSIPKYTNPLIVPYGIETSNQDTQQ